MARLALTGGLFSGKTTLADALVERSKFKKIDYTGLLKRAAAMALQACGLEVTVEDILSDKEKYRPLLIELGHVLDFDHCYGIEEIIEQLEDDESYVFDNCRFDAQYE